MKKKEHFSIIIIFVIIILLTSCSNNDFGKFSNEYYDTYKEIVRTTDPKNTKGTLEALQSEENKGRIDRLKIILDNLDSKVLSSKADYYSTMKDSYDGLIFLRDSYGKWSSMKFEEQTEVWTQIGLLKINDEIFDSYR